MTLKIEDVRPAVQGFAILMEERLRENDHKGSWSDCDRSYLVGSMHGKILILKTILLKQRLPPTREGIAYVRKKAVDAANFLMLIVDNFGG